jgi:hypothetical protein
MKYAFALVAFGLSVNALVARAPAASASCTITKTVTVTMAKPTATPAPQQPTSTQPAPAPAHPTACPADLNGSYEYPHLIVPVSSSSPDKAYGTSYNGKVDKTTCSIFNFDIPYSYAGKQCTAIFLFPEQKDLVTSSYTISGSGQCSFSKLSKAADEKTTYANMPSKEAELAKLTVAPGNSYVIASGDCAAGQKISYEMCSGGDFALDYFQDYNPSPIGMYVRTC